MMHKGVCAVNFPCSAMVFILIDDICIAIHFGL